MELKEYFQSYDTYFWEWENEVRTADSVFETLAIPGGNTIAYERFVMETLDLLSLDGFPPFGSLLLALIATNANGQEALGQAFEIISRLKPAKEDANYTKGFAYARQFLNTLAGLPPQFKEGNKRKMVMQTIFKDCHNRISAFKATAILQQYKEQKHLLTECATKKPYSAANLNRDIQTLRHIHAKYPTQQALLEAMGGVPELPELDEKINERQPVGTSANFVNELIADPKTFPAGSLIQRIWGGLNIPLHHSAPSLQPLGGVSDLTNKGDFDKLLISEFANDDTIFMSRIANNEALYIKREVPPESDKFVRLLLVDCSLKNWGTPKILAFASALAIARHPKTDIACKIFALGNTYTEVAADTVTDVIEALNHLGSKLNAAPALQALLDENTDVDHSEVFLITTEDALAQAGMQRTLSDNPNKVKYIITAETGGNIYFYRLQNGGRKQIQHIYLPLEELWAKKPGGGTPGRNKHSKKGDTMPDVHYPILMPPAKKRQAVFWSKGDDYYTLTGTGALFKTHVTVPAHNEYFRFHKGTELLLHNLSVTAGGEYALQVNEYNEYILAAFYKKDKLVSILNLNTREYHKKKIDLKPAARYMLCENKGFYLFNETADEYLHLYTRGGQLHVEPTAKKEHLAKDYADAKKKTEKFEKGLINYNVLKNFLPVFITPGQQLQFNKHRLVINKDYRAHTHINFISTRDSAATIMAIYEKESSRFVFPDGSAVYRDAAGIIILKSSNSAIPHIYLPTTLDSELAMATDAFFAGNKEYFKGDPGQKIIPIEEFENNFLEPFIQTIVSHGV